MHDQKLFIHHFFSPLFPSPHSNVKGCCAPSRQHLPPLTDEDNAVRREREKIKAGEGKTEGHILTLDHVTRVYSSGAPWKRTHRAAVNQLCLAMQRTEVSCFNY